MYFKKEIVNDIGRFKLTQNSYIFCNRRYELIFEGVNYGKIDCNSINLNGNELEYRDNDGTLFSISPNKQLKAYKNKTYVFESIEDNNAIYSFNMTFKNEGYFWETGVCDLAGNHLRTIKSLENFGVLYRHKDLVIGASSGNLFKGVSLIKDLDLWQFSFSTLGTYTDGEIEKEYKLQKFCGIYSNKLVLVLENSDVLLLDANSGKLLQHFKDAYFNYYSSPKSEGSNIYWSLVGKHFTELDVDKQVVTRQINLEAELLRHNAQDPKNTFHVFIKRIVVYYELIYFYTSDNQLGVFSPQEEKIIWFHKMDIGQPSGNFFTDIQVNDKSIYVLDYSGTLYIFEREKDISIT